ncbi:MAG TPA: hypothetical protein VM260_26925 [Pirellula sp.]|nr:hypothetical protein [Pirellula sp.]
MRTATSKMDRSVHATVSRVFESEKQAKKRPSTSISDAKLLTKVGGYETILVDGEQIVKLAVNDAGDRASERSAHLYLETQSSRFAFADVRSASGSIVWSKVKGPKSKAKRIVRQFYAVTSLTVVDARSFKQCLIAARVQALVKV